jgi:hypothetical protein
MLDLRADAPPQTIGAAPDHVEVASHDLPGRA